LDIQFQWPWALYLLALIPLLVWAYHKGLRPKAESVVLHPNVAFLVQASRQSSGWRYLPPALYLAALVLGILALARPNSPIFVSNPRAGIILALDISRSMQATDVRPSRFEAARDAMRSFVREMPEGAKVGLVTFSRNATLVVPLTTNKAKLLQAIDGLELDLGTAIGEAILESISALPSYEERKDAKDPLSLATIILLTDGRNMGGADPMEAAAEAKKQVIRINTIGVGSITDGPVPGLPEAYQYAAHFDPEDLKAIAATANGQYIYVNSFSTLKTAYSQLTKQIIWKVKKDEVTNVFALVAGFLLLSSLLFSEARRRVL